MSAAESLGEGMDRRVFLSQATLAAVGALLASSCGGGSDGGATAPAPIPGGTGLRLTVTPSTIPALATVGGMATVGTLNSTPIAVVRTTQTEYLALSQRCTPQGCTVAVVPPSGATAGYFSCEPSRTNGCGHGSKFSATGAVTQGPANRALQRLNVVVGTDGSLTITP